MTRWAVAEGRGWRRWIGSFFFVPLGFAAALAVQVGLEGWSRYSAYGYYDVPPRWLVSELVSLVSPALVLAALAALPLTPIVWLARAGDSDDHDARARLRIGASLAAASLLQLGCIAMFLLFAGGSPDAIKPLYLVPSAAAFLFGLVELVRSLRVLASLRAWLSRVRVGEVRGVRVRAEEAADSTLYVPDLVTAGFGDAHEVLEAYAECSHAGPYRMKRSSVPLGRVPRQ